MYYMVSLSLQTESSIKKNNVGNNKTYNDNNNNSPKIGPTHEVGVHLVYEEF